MPTLKERIEAFFMPEIFVRLSQKRKMWDAQREVKDFFRQELLAVAEEIDRIEKSDALNHHHAGNIIRFKADEFMTTLKEWVDNPIVNED